MRDSEFSRVSEWWLKLALMESRGEIVGNDGQTSPLTNDIRRLMLTYYRPVNPAWVHAWKMAHSEHNTIDFNHPYCTPQIWL